MTISSRKEALVLFLGDILIFYISLWTMLLVRYGALPSRVLWETHAAPFTILFAVWLLVFFIAGLYEKHTVILKSKLPGVIFQAQLVNSTVAVLFFYLIPYFGITPKTNLFIHLVISFALVLSWRLYGHSLFALRSKQNALLIGSGQEMKELQSEVNNNPRYDLHFISSLDLDEVDSIDFKEDILNRVYTENVHVVAIDIRNEKVEPILPHLYNLIFSKIRFVDMHRVYEDIFDKIPLSLVRYSWFLENISTAPKRVYDGLKRLMDLALASLLGIISIIFYPFIVSAIKLDDGGDVFFTQERVGSNNRLIRILKFRTMGVPDGAEQHITRVGKFLRASRVDELPQIWNVIRGDLSLIGPRPELPSLVKVYEKEIPYYNIRHLIKPGLSGWAQLYHKEPPKFAASSEATREKLSFDLYYIKNRSFVLDIKIALKTLKTLVSRSGK